MADAVSASGETAPAQEAVVPVAAEASAEQRVSELARILAGARVQVTGLEQHAAAMAEKATQAWRRADQESGDQAHAAAVAAEADLVPARARLASLEDAQRAVNAELQRELWQRQAAGARARETEALDELDRQAALIPAALAAARQAIKRARAAEEAARRAQAQADEFEASLEGRTWRKPATHNRAQAVIDSSPLLLDIERSSGV